MKEEADAVEAALINERLAELLGRGSALSISLAELAKKAIDEAWTDEEHESARQKPLAQMISARAEIHELTYRLSEIKNQSKNAD